MYQSIAARILVVLWAVTFLAGPVLSQTKESQKTASPESTEPKKETGASAPKAELIDLNSATKEQLMARRGRSVCAEDHRRAALQDEDRTEDQKDRSGGNVRQDRRQGDREAEVNGALPSRAEVRTPRAVLTFPKCQRSQSPWKAGPGDLNSQNPNRNVWNFYVNSFKHSSRFRNAIVCSVKPMPGWVLRRTRQTAHFAGPPS